MRLTYTMNDATLPAFTTIFCSRNGATVHVETPQAPATGARVVVNDRVGVVVERVPAWPGMHRLEVRF